MKQLSIAFVCAGIALAAASAHEGHPDAPGTGSAAVSPVIKIAASARDNLGIRTTEAEFQTIERTLTALGHVEPLPQNLAAVTSRIPGRVIQIAAAEGERVEKGAPLVVIESLQVGNPPPRATATSPIDGIVIDRHVVVGASVEPSGHLLDVADLSAVHVAARIFEGQIAQVHPEQKVRVRVEAYPDEIFEGHVERLAGTLDPDTRTLEAHVHIENAASKLRPNMQASAYIVTAESDEVIAVSVGAVIGEAGSRFLFVQTDEEGLEYERRAVVEGVRNDRVVEIIDGVLPGERVVVEGNYQLQYVTVEGAEEDTEKTLLEAAEAAHGHSHGEGEGHGEGQNHADHSDDTAQSAEAGEDYHPHHGPGALTLGLAAGLAVSVLANLVLLARNRRSHA